MARKKKKEDTLPIHVQSEQSFEKLLDNLAYPSVIHSDGKVMYGNKAAARLFKFRTPKELLNRDTLAFIHPDYLKVTGQRIKEVYEKGFTPENDNSILDRYGKVLRVKTSGTLINYKGTPSVLATIRDISEQHDFEEQLQASEKQYRQLVENVNEGIIKFDANEVIIYVNRGFCEMVGYSSKELVGKVGHDFLITTKDSREAVKHAIKDRRKGESTKYEVQLRTKSNKLMWVSMNGAPIYDEEGIFEGSIGIVTNISYSKKGQLALEMSEMRFRSLFENAYDLIQSVSSDGTFVFVNNAWLKTLGYSQASVKKLNMVDIVHPDSKKHCMEMFGQVIKGKSVRNVEATFLKKNGDKVEVKGNVTLHKTREGELMTQGIFTDVTQDKRAEIQIRKSEEKFRALVDKMNEGIVLVDNKDIIQYVNKRFCEMVGFKSRELVGKKGSDVLGHDKVSKEKINRMVRLRRKGISSKYEVRFRRKNGVWIDVSMNGSPLYDEDGQVRGSMGIVTDVTSAREAQEALAQSEKLFRTLVEKMNEGVIRLGADENIEYVNDRFCEILGYSQKDLIGKNRFKVLSVDESSIGEIKRTVSERKKGESSKYELRHKRKNGDWIWVSVNGTPFLDDKGKTIGSMGIVTDITNQKRFEEEINELNAGLEDRVERRTDELEKANTEIRALLREMHHRVKNNLQIVSSLLNMQAASVDDEYIADSFRESQDRIQTMAFIHESLYLNESMSEISVSEYLVPLVKDRIRANAGLGSNIRLNTEFPDINMKIDTMLPIGLLLNELVTNSLKHAFPNEKAGSITVKLKRSAKTKLLLTYTDDGIGFPVNETGDSTGSLGLILIDSFAMQLDGKMKRLPPPGTRYELLFEPI